MRLQHTGKRLLLVLGIALSLGFIINVPESPEVRRDREERESRWKNALDEHYDLSALRNFLRDTIGERKIFDGVDLTRSNLAEQWALAGQIATCGDWRLELTDPRANTFQLRWDYDYTPPIGERNGVSMYIALSCERLARDRFHLIAMRKGEDELVILTP